MEHSGKTAWVFGAGASACEPYNIPLQRELLSTFLGQEANTGTQLEQLQSQVRDLCKAVYRGRNPADASLEEVFASYELVSSEGWGTSDDQAKAREAVVQLRKALLQTVKVRGRGDARKWKPHQRSDQQSPYAELLEKIAPLGCDDGLLSKHALVTMNYDINLDRCLINMRAEASGQVDVDYGFEFGNHRIPGEDLQFDRPGPRSLLLIRLHGALNWIRCCACEGLVTTVNRQATVVERQQCPLCKCAALEPVMVHPSHVRSYEDPILKLVWGRCFSELIGSDRWVFIGYSMPDADAHFRELIRSAMRLRVKRRKTTEVIWVGRRNETNDHRSWNAMAVNYHSVFRRRAEGWIDDGTGFCHFVSQIS